MEETASLLPNHSTSINNENEHKIRMSFLRQLGYGIYNTGQFACVIPFMLVMLPNRVQQFVSDEDKVIVMLIITNNYQGKALGFILMAGNIALAIAGPLMGHMSDTMSCGIFAHLVRLTLQGALPKRKTFLVFGTLLACSTLIGVTLAPFYSLVVLFFTGLCLSVAISGPSFMAILSDIAYKNEIDKTTSVATTLQEIGGIIGSVAGLVIVSIKTTSNF